MVDSFIDKRRKTQLKSYWHQYYVNFSYSREMSTNKLTGAVNKRFLAYNRLFYNWLQECQEDGHMPTLEEVKEASASLFESASSRVVFTNNVVNRLSYPLAKKAIEEGTTELTLVQSVENNEEYNIHCHLTVHCAKLSQDEINFFIQHMHGEYLNSYNSLIFLVMDVPYTIKRKATPKRDAKIKSIAHQSFLRDFSDLVVGLEEWTACDEAKNDIKENQSLKNRLKFWFENLYLGII